MKVEQIQEQISCFTEEKKRLEIQLLGKTEALPLQQRIEEIIKTCKELSRDLKRGQEVGSILESVKSCKREFRILSQEVKEKHFLLSRRQELYGSTTLASPPSFRLLLSEGVSRENRLEIERIFKIRFRVSEGKISRADIDILQKMIAQTSSSETESFLRKEATRFEESFANQIKYLQAFFTEIGSSLPPPEEMWRLYLGARMQLDNPFEIPFDPMELLNQVEEAFPLQVKELRNGYQKKRPIWKKECFLDFLPPWEREAQRRASSEEQKINLKEERDRLLRQIIDRNSSARSTQEVLIIGGGPCGLMHALTFALLGKPYRVVEKRESSRQTRNNVITLGKVNPRDLYVLSFLGILNRLKGKASFAHLRPYQVEVKIADLETTLKDTLASIHQIDRIHFTHRVANIDFQNQQAIVQIIPVNQETYQCTPSAVVVADGAKSPTRALLGVGRWKLAKTTQVAFSIFHRRTQPLSPSGLLRYKFFHGSRALLNISRLFIRAIRERSTLERAYALIAPGGPSAIFRIPSQDYVIRCLKKEEQEENQKLLDRLFDLDQKLMKHKDKELMLKEKQKEVNEELQRNLGDRAQQMHLELDLTTSILGCDHRADPMQVSENYLVNIDVFRAEKTTVLVGKTPFFIRGDASHLTDPYCGFGGKTAIEECMADTAFFSPSLTDQIGQLDLALQDWVHGYYRDGMIDRGLFERFDYQRGTEYFWRYAVLAIDEGIVTEEEAIQLAKIDVGAAPFDFSFVSQIRSRLQEELERRQIDSRGPALSEQALAQLAWEGKKEAGILALFQKVQKQIVN